MVDRRNHHVFQPLLYQVATAALSPAEIASPIRNILKGAKNCRVVLAEVESIDLAASRVIIRDVAVRYDYLVLAAGATHSYFGRDDFATTAPGLKTLEDAIEIRKRIILSFEEAEYEDDPEIRQAKLTFMIIGGGPTGVEMAGAIKEIAAKSLPSEFRNIDTTSARVILVEGADRLLGTFAPELSANALKQLNDMGVEVKLNSRVTDIKPGVVTIGDEQFRSQNIFWAAGVQGNSLGKKLGTELDRAGRVVVSNDCSIPGHSNVFVIGDMASHKEAATGKLVPGVAQVPFKRGSTLATYFAVKLKVKPSRMSEHHSVTLIRARSQPLGEHARLARSSASRSMALSPGCCGPLYTSCSSSSFVIAFWWVLDGYGTGYSTLETQG